MFRTAMGWILACTLLVAGTGVRAAANQAGVKGGIAIQKLGGDDVESDVESRTGFVGGAYFQSDFSESFGLRLEALYFMKGATADSADIEVAFNLDYLEVPVLLVGQVPLSETARLSLFAGPTFGVSVSAEGEVSAGGLSLSGDIGDAIADFEFGLTFGAGLSFDVGSVILGFDGRYGLGLTTIADEEFEDEFNVEDADVTNEGFAFMASLGWPLGAK